MLTIQSFKPLSVKSLLIRDAHKGPENVLKGGTHQEIHTHAHTRIGIHMQEHTLVCRNTCTGTHTHTQTQRSIESLVLSLSLYLPLSHHPDPARGLVCVCVLPATLFQGGALYLPSRSHGCCRPPAPSARAELGCVSISVVSDPVLLPYLESGWNTLII